MRLKNLTFLLSWIFSIFLFSPFLGNEVGAGILHEKIDEKSKTSEEKICESWMGIYMNGIKVGYNQSQKFSLVKGGKRYKKDVEKSWMEVSRLGGNPVEVVSIQESLYDEEGRPLECILRTKMSETETVMKAAISLDRISFKLGDRVVKELPYKGKFYLAAPVEKIIEKGGLISGKEYTFKILDLTSRSLVDCKFKVVGREDILILGKRINLWHVNEKVSYILPISIDEWIDESGRCWKSVSRTSFATLSSIWMPKEKALEKSKENFDIAFSTVIKSNILFENPQEVQKVTFKLSGISLNRIKKLPFNEQSQKILEWGEDYALVRTSSQIFREEDAIHFPVKDERFKKYLKPSLFCQSNDPEIKEKALEIVGREENIWRAAKKIAKWIREEMTPNYDVGFATAKETLKNLEGDCSEHTVLAVALCRAVGIPARAAVGVMYAQGLFAYHMWPEVFVGQWIGLDAKWLAIDKESGEWYTDATHIKFGMSLLDENIFKEMAQAVSQLIGQIKLEIIDYFWDK